MKEGPTLILIIAPFPSAYINGIRGGGESVPRSFDKFNGEQFRDNSDGGILLLSVTETSCIGTLILHITYHSLQHFNRLSGRAKYAKGKVHGFRIWYVSPRHPPLQEVQL